MNTTFFKKIKKIRLLKSIDDEPYNVKYTEFSIKNILVMINHV